MSICNTFIILFVWIRIAIGLSVFLVVNVVVSLAILLSCIIFCFDEKLRKRTVSITIHWLMKFIFIGLVRWLGGYDLFIKKNDIDFSKPSIFIANHISLFDPLLLFSIIPNLGVIIKSKYSSVLAIWLLVKVFDFIVVRSDGTDEMQKVIDKTKRAVKLGRNMLIFPEGRRSKPARILELKNSAFKLSKDLNLQIIPIAIYSPRPFLSKGEFMIKEKTYYHIEFLYPINPQYYHSARAMNDVAYKQILKAVKLVRDKSQERPQQYYPKKNEN